MHALDSFRFFSIYLSIYLALTTWQHLLLSSLYFHTLSCLFTRVHSLSFFLSFYSPLPHPKQFFSAAFDPSLHASTPHSPAVAPDIKTNQPWNKLLPLSLAALSELIPVYIRHFHPPTISLCKAASSTLNFPNRLSNAAGASPLRLNLISSPPFGFMAHIIYCFVPNLSEDWSQTVPKCRHPY